MKEEFEKELQELSPFLADLKKQQKQEPFKTPRLYFDTLADKVLEKEKNKAIVPPQYNQHPSLYNRINVWLSTIFQPKLALSAFGLVLIVAVGWYVINQQKQLIAPSKEQEITISELPKNNGIETVAKDNTSEATIGKDTKLPDVDGENKPKAGDNKEEMVGNQPKLNALEIAKPMGITHPKSGLTEEEIEEFLKDALVDEDLEAVGGKL